MKKANILIVEDERIVAEDIKSSLLEMGFGVVGIASSGVDAIKKSKIENPGLVLMDIMLEGDMNGIETSEQIRVLFNIPVVFLTAYTDEDIITRAKKTEPYGYIVKPFEDIELVSTIEVALYKHKMETKLRQNEAWLSTTLRSIGDAVITTDAKAKITFINPIGENLTGWKQEEAIGKELTDVYNIINEKTQEKFENPVDKLLLNDSNIIPADHAILISKNGIKIPIDESGSPIKDLNGNIIGIVLIFRDITKRRQAEEELQIKNVEIANQNKEFETINEELYLKNEQLKKAKKITEESEERYRSLIEINSSIIWTTDANGGFVTPQLSWENFTGQSWDEQKGYGWTKKIHPDDTDHILKVWNKAIKDMSIYETYGRVWNNNLEEWRDFEVRAIPLKNKDGTVREWVGGITDITERKKAEQELIKAKGEAEKKEMLIKQQYNAIHTSEEELISSNEELQATSDALKINYKELKKAKEKAEESDQLKTEFINNMSHEIRTPMNGILGFSSFLNKPDLSEEKRKQFIKIIQNSGKQLLHIIDDILEISKLGTKQIKPQFEEICLNDLLLELFSIFDIKAKENKTPLYLKKMYYYYRWRKT
jgi:PAS domain S-box-containing protein